MCDELRAAYQRGRDDAAEAVELFVHDQNRPTNATEWRIALTAAARGDRPNESPLSNSSPSARGDGEQA